MSSRSDRRSSGYYTDRSPEYPVVSREATVSVGVATVLVVGTLGLMWLARGTALAEGTVWLFDDGPLAPHAGIFVFGLVLMGCRLWGMDAAADGRYWIAAFVSTVLGVTYAAFGAGVLTQYGRSIHASAVLVTAGITTACTVGAAVLVYTTDHSFANWSKYSGGFMFAGIIAVVSGELMNNPSALLLGFGLVLIGWLVDLVFEIYMVSDKRRPPLANGFGVYIAFMGVFVHLLQLVLAFGSSGD